jgi:hypothetical protein
MDRTEALKTLHAAGQFSAAENYIAEQTEHAQRSYKQISTDDQYSEAGKRKFLAIDYVQRLRSIDRELVKMAGKVVVSDRDDAERVFGTKGIPGDAASLTISRRDAADRVAAITDAAELRELLRKATRSGDEVLARAIAEKAVDNQDVKTMNQFLADRPALDGAGERLWNAQQAGHTFAIGAVMLNLRPSELVGMSTWAIEQLAETAPGEEPRSSPFPPVVPETRGGDAIWPTGL